MSTRSRTRTARGADRGGAESALSTATIYDVAKRAGVSPATVSRVYNGVGVSPAKTEAVQRAARELKFVPNSTARNLRTGSANAIALVIPDIENPYFTETARGIEDVASAAGYSVMLCNSDGDIAKESTYLGIAASAHMAGVILAAAGDDTDVSALRAAGRPIIAVDRSAGGGVDSVLMANRAAGYAATIDLLDAGYRRVACMVGGMAIETSRERAQGWRDAMAERLGSADPALLYPTTFHLEGGRVSIDALLAAENPPDAFVAGNNLIGMGAIQRLAELGTPPPAYGMAVIGSLPYTIISPSSVSIVRLPAREMGMTAARMLLDRLGGDDSPPRTVVLGGELQPRSAP